MTFSFSSVIGIGCFTKITNSGYGKYKYEFNECPLQKCFLPPNFKTNNNMQLEMKLKTLKSEVSRKINSHMK
jgi:hypothetical protein